MIRPDIPITSRQGSCKNEEICNDLEHCYLERNIGIAWKKLEHKSIDISNLRQEYYELLIGYWKNKIENFTDTGKGNDFE